MYGTWVKNEREARKFWAEVAGGGVEFEESHPTTVLDAWLKAVIRTRGRNATEARTILPGQHLRAECLAWRQDNQI
jgi:hypothetical protein